MTTELDVWTQISSPEARSPLAASLTPRLSLCAHPPPPCPRRRKDRESKKFSKQVAGERRKDRAQERKRSITEVSKLRKQRQKSVSRAALRRTGLLCLRCAAPC